MPLNPPVPRLRVFNGSRQIAKVQINVAPGDELEVSEDLAAQLVDARVGIRKASKPKVKVELDHAAVAEAVAKAEPVKKAAKKSAAPTEKS